MTQIITQLECILLGKMTRLAIIFFIISVGFMAGANAGTLVRIETALGNVDVELFDDIAPQTVTNFLNYVGRGDYDGTFIHRVETGFVLQAGGWIFNPENGGFSQGGVSHIPTDPPVPNEFDLSNVRGTIAMAKGSNPDSATSEWFINLDDNSTALDNPLNSGGFTVFGMVTECGMNIVDDLVAIPTFSFAANPVYGFPGFSTLPLFNYPSGLPVQTSNLVLLNRVSITEPDDDDGDCVVNSIEDAAPNGGDGNGDGVADRLQANVASLFDALDYPVTLVAPGSTRLFSVTSLGEEFLVTNISSVGELFDGFNLGHGFFQFSVRDVAPGGAVDLDLIVHSGPSPDTYFKFGPTADDPLPHWYKFKYDGQTGADVNGNVVTLRFEDGGRGDSDLVANGEITDPGAPATKIGNSGSGNGGGGCALQPESIHRNYDGGWLLLAMFILWVRVYRRLRSVDT